MALPFVGEIRMFGGNFAPLGWALCDGQLLPIAENEVLFQLIGTTYGGDGQETFALPDLRGRIPIHQGNGRIIGELDGSETVTLTANQLPTHTHPLLVSTTLASDPNPQGRVLAQTRAAALYLDDAPTVPLSPNAVTPQGGSQPHDNMMPFVGINFIISLFGIFPSPT